MVKKSFRKMRIKILSKILILAKIAYHSVIFIFNYVGKFLYSLPYKLFFAKKLNYLSSENQQNNVMGNPGNLLSAPMQSNGNQPPDLDQVFEEWKKKLDNLMRDFNKKGSGNNGSGDGGGRHGVPGFKFPKALILIAASIIAIFFWLISGFYTVDANERGVVLQFGRYVYTTDPGWHWRLPYPFQSHHKVDLSSVRTFELTGNSRQTGTQMLTGDENVIQVQFTVQFDVKDPYSYVFVDIIPEETTRLAAETAMREVVGNSTMDRVLSENREQVASEVRTSMQNILDRYGVGIRVIRVNLQSVNPPAEVQAAFDDVIKARQDLDRQINEGQAYQQKVVPLARGRASRMIEDANAYKQEAIARAEGETSRFNQLYDEYKYAKVVTRERMYLDAIGEVLSKNQKIVIDPNVRSVINLGNLGESSASGKIIPLWEDNTKTTDTSNANNQNRSRTLSPAEAEIERRRSR